MKNMVKSEINYLFWIELCCFPVQYLEECWHDPTWRSCTTDNVEAGESYLVLNPDDDW